LAKLVIDHFLFSLQGQYNEEKTKPIFSFPKVEEFGNIGRNSFDYYDATPRTTVLEHQYNPGFSTNREHEEFHCLTQNSNMDVGPFMRYQNFSTGVSFIHDWGRMFSSVIQGDQYHTNGSFVVALQFLYDRLPEFKQLPEPMGHGSVGEKSMTQDGTFGRVKKPGYFAGSPEEIPPNCHTLKNFVPITDQKPGDTPNQQFIERTIYRQAGEYKEEGDDEKGVARLFFTAYCSTCDTFNNMLGNMTAVHPDINGNQEPDLLFNYVVCLSGNQYYCPNWRELVVIGMLYQDGNPN